MRVRAAGRDDLPAVVATEAGADTATWLAETGSAWHERAFADPDQRHLVGVLDGEVVGFAVLAGVSGSGPVELRRLVVGAGHRGTGLGRSLLRASVAHDPDRVVWLDVKRTNERARRLYESEGFTVTDPVPFSVTAPDLLVLVHRPDGAAPAAR